MSDKEPEPKACPPYCDWPSVGHHIKEELMRISASLSAMTIQFQQWMQASRTDTDAKFHNMMEDVARQLLTLSEACKVNLEMNNQNRIDLAAIKAILARNVAMWSAISAGGISMVLILVQKLLFK